MGGEFRRGVDDFDLGSSSSALRVQRHLHGDSFADFLLGRAVEFNHAKGRTKLAMRNELRRVFQDDIKVRDNFTLNWACATILQPITDAPGPTSPSFVPAA